MKILVIEPEEPDETGIEKSSCLCLILKKLGHEVLKAFPDSQLLKQVIDQKPDLVFNLASAYKTEKADRIPAILEIANVPYTGAGLLGLSFNRFYNLLFPLLAESGIPTAPFAVMKAGQFSHPDNLKYPLSFFKEGARDRQMIKNEDELNIAIAAIAPHEDVILFGHVQGEKKHLYMIDIIPFLEPGNNNCLESALEVGKLIEVRGLVRYDFVFSDEILLTGIDTSPHPLDERLLQDASKLGWDTERLIQYLVEHGGQD